MSIEICTECCRPEDTDFHIGIYFWNRGYVCTSCADELEVYRIHKSPVREISNVCEEYVDEYFETETDAEQYASEKGIQDYTIEREDAINYTE